MKKLYMKNRTERYLIFPSAASLKMFSFGISNWPTFTKLVTSHATTKAICTISFFFLFYLFWRHCWILMQKRIQSYSTTEICHMDHFYGAFMVLLLWCCVFHSFIDAKKDVEKEDFGVNFSFRDLGWHPKLESCWDPLLELCPCTRNIAPGGL